MWDKGATFSVQLQICGRASVLSVDLLCMSLVVGEEIIGHLVCKPSLVIQFHIALDVMFRGRFRSPVVL